MPNYKVVDADRLDSDLIIVADAIRAKTGETDTLAFPLGMKNALDNLETGGNLEGYFDGSVTDVELPNVTKIKDFAFYKDASITNVYMPNVTEVGSQSFRDCTALKLTELPANLKKINTMSFRGCTSITRLIFPSTLTYLAANAFADCVGLELVTFLGKPTTVDNLTFTGCTNLTTINVPWAEGAVAGAPWGATNATINYASSATTISGVRKFVPTLVSWEIEGMRFDVNFTSNGKQFVAMCYETLEYLDLAFVDSSGELTRATFYDVFYQEYQTVDFGDTPQEIDSVLYDFLMDNTTEP